MCKRLSALIAISLLPISGFLGYIHLASHGLSRSVRDYSIDIIKSSPSDSGPSGQLQVGVSKVNITPKLTNYDAWIDVDGDSKFEPWQRDIFLDRNHNHWIEMVWLAGFSLERPAQGVNDDLWVRAMAFKSNGIKIVIVSIDSIGLTYDQIIPIRQSISKLDPSIDHIVIAATHTHSAPDLIGLWSYRFLLRDKRYPQKIRYAIQKAVLGAVKDLRPAKATIVTAKIPEESYIHDSRGPKVLDNQMPLALFQEAKSGHTIGLLASWGMHPIAMGDTNKLISSDFIHYFRNAIENGLSGPKGFPGYAGICVYLSGPLGSMKPTDYPLHDLYGYKVKTAGILKAKTLGENLAILAHSSLKSRKASIMTSHRLAFSAQTYYFAPGWPVALMLYLGLFHPGIYDGKIKTEVNALRIGEIEVLTTPGELFPEMYYGGIENPEGADYKMTPVETLPLVSAMKSRIKMNFNVANDAIGYLVPKSQWDVSPPFTYSRTSGGYEEIYTSNPDFSSLVYQASIAQLRRLHSALDSHQ